MIELKLKMDDFERAALNAGQALDQVPYALSQALNDAMKVARSEIVDVQWPRTMNVHNSAFMGWMMRMEFAGKHNLKVRLFNREPREFLPRQAEGGTKGPHRGSQIALPSTFVKASRSSTGIPTWLRPRNVPNSFRKGNAIYQRLGKGRVRLLYTLKSQAHVPKRFPAHETWDRIMRSEVMRAFGPRMQAAMRTRR